MSGTTAFVAIFFVFKSSNDTIIKSLDNSVFENWFKPFDVGNNIIFNISISYLSSVIFYFIVIFLPERRKRKDIEPYINSKVEGLIFSLSALNHSIITTAGKEYNFKTLTKEELAFACANINPKENKSSFHNNGLVFEHHFGYKCFNDWCRITSTIEDIFRFLPYIDTGLVFYFNKIKTSKLRVMIEALKGCENFSNTDMSDCADCFFEIYQLNKLLRDYYVSEHKHKFINDPWK